jgi:phosphoribosylaminoimidazole-succinocarboxamide synthase
VMLARKYIEVFELLTGETFVSAGGDVQARIEQNLRKAGLL